MQIQRMSDYKTNFGMALYRPNSAKVEKTVGKFLSAELDTATPRLAKLAKDIDIKIYTYNSNNLAHRGFDIFISPIKPEIKNPIKRLFHQTPYIKKSVHNYELSSSNQTMSDLILEKTKEAIAELSRFA